MAPHKIVTAVLWTSIYAGLGSAGPVARAPVEGVPAKPVAGDDAGGDGLKPDWVCLENCKREMQVCIDECGTRATSPPAHHANQVLPPPMPQAQLPGLDHWDANGDGRLSPEELRSLFDFGLTQRRGDKRVGRSAASGDGREEEFNEFLHLMDSDGDGFVSQDEFDEEDGESDGRGEGTGGLKGDEDDFTNLPLPDFDYWDTDKDGLLSVNEAYRLYHFGLEQHDLLSTESSAEVVSSFEDFFRAIDENGDGAVSRAEFDDEDDEGASGGATKAVHSVSAVHAAKAVQPSRIAQPAKAPKPSRPSISAKSTQSPASPEGFLSHRSGHGRQLRRSNSIREMARMMTALNGEVRGL